MDNSILNNIKKLLNVPVEDTAFDTDIIIHINSAFTTLAQLGVGPVNGFRITDNTAVWDTFFDPDLLLDNVKTYVYLKVKIVFDPPATSFGISAVQDEIKQLEWRINVEREGKRWTRPITPPDPMDPEEPDWADEVETIDGGVIGGS